MEERDYYVKLIKESLARGTAAIAISIIVSAVIFLFSSCATKTRVEYRDVNHYITNTVHDTLIDKYSDSVYVNVYVKGDTVYSEKYKEKIRFRDRIVERHDTCYKDSVVTKTEVTTKEIIKIPKIFYISLVISVICIIFAIVKLLRWLKKL